jgi:hypothetical protein
MANKDTIKFGLEFPQGQILFTSSNGTYFLPHQGVEGFMIWGDRKELFGKNALSITRGEDVPTPYTLVHEFNEAGALTDARLIADNQTTHGALMDSATVQALNAAITNDTVQLFGYQDLQKPRVFNAARFPDGRLLIQMHNKNELWLGTPEAGYEKVDAQLYVQGGNSMYYKTPEGEKIDLPYSFGGPRHGEPPMYKGIELTYIDVKRDGDPAQFGLSFTGGHTPVNPFTPGLPQKAAAPKAPGL